MRSIFLVLVLVLASCGADSTPSETSATTTTTDNTTTTTMAETLTFEFENGSDGWAADVSDFSDATRPDDVLVETGVAPPGMDAADGFNHLAATNRSDDLFQFMSRKLTDLQPSTEYSIAFTVTFASNAPTGCAGVGGAPGESVWMKAGASAVQPTPIEQDDRTSLPIDKGNQSTGGSDAIVIGDVANGIPCEEALSQDPQPYALVTNTGTMNATTTNEGELWLIVGIDSGFEARTSLYYDRIEVVLTPIG